MMHNMNVTQGTNLVGFFSAQATAKTIGSEDISVSQIYLMCSQQHTGSPECRPAQGTRHSTNRVIVNIQLYWSNKH